MTTLLTVSADITAGALKTIVTELLDRPTDVAAGRWASVDLPAADAHRVATELRQRGYETAVR